MRLKQIKHIYFKEMLDTLKDRRTLISMIVIPILVIPVLMFGIGALISSQVQKAEEKTKRLAIFGQENAPRLTERILAQGKFTELTLARDSLEQALQDKRLEVALEIPANFELDLQKGDPAGVVISYDQAEVKSELAQDQLKKIIRQFEEDIVEAKLKAVNLNKESISPIKITSRNLAPQEKMSGFFLSMFLPYMLMILCLTGAMYPAMDLTAGEKERGTLETLLVTPASRLDIAAGKFLAVLTASFVTGILATTSMTLTSFLGMLRFDDSPQAASLSLSINPVSILLVVLLIIPMACLFSALLLSLSLVARSYKEAQSYVSPLMIVVIFPAMVSFIPGFEFQAIHTLIPVLNTSLVLKDVLLGTFEWGKIGLVFLVNTGYAAFGVFLAKQMFEKESVLFRV